MWGFSSAWLYYFLASGLRRLKTPIYAHKQLVETDMFHVLHGFLHEKPQGIHVLWTPEGMGKTYTICNLNAPNVVYWNCQKHHDFDQMFWKEVSLDYNAKLWREVLKENPPMTLVIDHYNNDVKCNATLEQLSHSMSVLIVCDHYEDVLYLKYTYNAKLLGQPYCGRWKHKIRSPADERWHAKTERQWEEGEGALRSFRA